MRFLIPGSVNCRHQARSLHKVLSILVFFFFIICSGGCTDPGNPAGTTSTQGTGTTSSLPDPSSTTSTTTTLKDGPPVSTDSVLIGIDTASPQHLDIVLETSDATASISPILSPEHWSVEGNRITGISRYSVPWDEKPALGTSYPVIVRHHIYLTLASPLVQGSSSRIKTPYGTMTFRFDEHESFCSSIKVNQAGYAGASRVRYGLYGVWLGDGGSPKVQEPVRYQVIRESDRAVILSGTAPVSRDDRALVPAGSGERVYTLDLAAVPAGGPYFVTVRGAGRSRSFTVGNSSSSSIAKVLARGFYHQRCGIALDSRYTDFYRDECSNHVTVALTRTPWTPSGWIEVSPSTPAIEVRGGYHDAGDFDRRPYHTIIPILMLAYQEAFPGISTDGEYNIPESGNGIPDFLDEALWAVLGWENLQLPDGAVMAGTETRRHPVYGRDGAASEDPSNLYGTWDADMKTTLEAAGFFALAARLVRPYDEKRSNALLAKAERAWLSSRARSAGAALPEPAEMYAALQLYLSKSLIQGISSLDSLYHRRFSELARKMVVSTGVWPDQYLPGNNMAGVQTAHFFSYLITAAPVDSSLKKDLADTVRADAEAGGYMGNLSLQPYPVGATRSIGWGAATAQGRYADVYCFAYRLNPDRRYVDTVSQYADYALGLNPLGKSFVSGLGTDQVNSVLHLDSYFTRYGKGPHEGNPVGNVPGLVVYGPSEGRSDAPYQRAVSDLVYPSWESLPVQRRWADGWSLVNSNEFSVWETSVWNLCMHAFLASLRL